MAKVIRQKKKLARELVGPAVRAFLKSRELVPAGPNENPFDIYDYVALGKAWPVVKEEIDLEWEAEGRKGRPYGYELFEGFQKRQERRRERAKENDAIDAWRIVRPTDKRPA